MTDGEKREIWRLTVENVSTAMKPEEEEREHNMYKDVSSSPHMSCGSRAGMKNAAFKHSLIFLSVSSCMHDTRST